MNVHVPTMLRSYTGERPTVEATGSTIAELLADLDHRYPGIRFRLVDEQDRLREHMKVFVNDTSVRDLGAAVTAEDDVTIMQALSGG